MPISKAIINFLISILSSILQLHDRFKTLEDVMAHYNGPMHRSESLDANLAKHPKEGLRLSKEDQAAIIAFLKTLTDPQYDVNN